MTIPLLEVHRLSKRLGGSPILDEVNFGVRPGEIVALMGANGSGKTTALDVIGRFIEPDSGDVLLDGQSLLRLPAHALGRMGVGRVFQLSRLSSDLAISTEVMLGDLWRHTLLGKFGIRAERTHHSATAELRGRVRRDVFAALGIDPSAGGRAADLPYVNRRFVEIARSMISGTRLLVLDEPTAGLTPTERARVSQALRLVRAAGIAVLLVDHDVRLISEIADRCVLLDAGRVMLEGDTASVLASAEMRRLYLGIPERVAC